MFFRGRRAVFFSMACAAAVTLQNFDASVVSATAYAQPSGAGSARYSAPRDRASYTCQRRATVVDTIADCDQVKGKHNDDLWKIALAIVIVGVIGYLLSRTKFSSGKDQALDQTLLENGPELPVSYPDGSFSVRGFTRDNWPIVLDFEPQPGTVTQLEVTVGNGRHATKQTIVLDPDGSRGRQLMKIEMPPVGAPVPTPATYFVSSVPIASLDTDHPASVRATPLQIYGIGGGPHAVGSVAIEQVQFARASSGARFSYFAKSEFSQARAQVQQFRRSGDRSEIVPIFDLRQSNLSIGRQVGAWPGTAAGSPVPSHGAHRLQVTGWFTTDDRSWVAAIAPDLVIQ